MNLWMLSVGYASGLAVCSLWAGEWARRKGLNAKAWSVAGLTAGPLAVAAVALRQAEAALCPHCKMPMRFEARYCATCRASEQQRATAVSCHGGAALTESNVLVEHGFFEAPQTGQAIQRVCPA